MYECVVVNKIGKATCSARLNVQAPQQEMKPRPVQPMMGHTAPQLIEPMRDQMVNEGEPANFQCKVVAQPGECNKPLNDITD